MPPQNQPPSPRPPVPDPLRRGHSMPGVGQPVVSPGSLPNATPPFQPDAQGQPGQNPYAFIMNPGPPPKQGSKLPGGSSLLGRIVVFGGALVVLLVLFVVIRGLLGGGPDVAPFVGIAQEQQALIQLSQAPAKEKSVNLSVASRNFAATAQLSLASSQSAVLSYLKDNGTKLKAKDLNLKVSSATTKQLADAQASGTYDQTFKDLAKRQLNTYSSSLRQAYATAGSNGKKLLNDDYEQAQLMLKQLDSN